MKVAVITPYFRVREDWLLQCHRSVLAQTHACTHVLVADGERQPVVDGWDAQHLVLPVNLHDYGDSPRGLGSVLAIAQGFDAIAYLDADNWYAPEHIARLVELHRSSGAAVLTASRNLHRLDGSLMGLCPECDGERFVDTNCYFLTRKAYPQVQGWWLLEPWMHAIADRLLLGRIRQSGLSRAHLSVPTVAYRSGYAAHYERIGETPPPQTRRGADISAALARMRATLQRRPGG